MPCLKPNGGCTPVGGCADCDDSGGTDPVLPKCQDVSLTPGSYANATIVVNDDGCISSIEEGEAPVYTPDDCCGDGAGAEGLPGPRGPKGDPGAAATISVESTIETNAGDSWTVENVGTSSAAIFKFTAPADDPTDCCPDGFTGEVCGVEVEEGMVKAMPPSLVTSLETQVTGEFAAFVNFVAGQNSVVTDPCGVMVTMNLDAFYYKIKEYIDNEVIELSQRIDGVQFGVRINGNTATNTSTSDVTITVQQGDGTVVSTLVVPSGGNITLPNTTGATYFVYQAGSLIGSYSTTT